MRFDLPVPDDETRPSWEACKQRRFLLRHCGACDRAEGVTIPVFRPVLEGA